MKVLNRPMFRIGGPIKEGIMHGIKEPRQRYQDAGQVFKNVENLLVTDQPRGDVLQGAKELGIGSPYKQNVFKPYMKRTVTKPIDQMMLTEEDFSDVENYGTATEPLTDLQKAKIGKIFIGNEKYRQKVKELEALEKAKNLKSKADGTVTTQGKSPFAYTADEVIKTEGKVDSDDDEPKVLSRKEKVNSILESLGYDRAQKNALYDAMIKAGQRISRTGLGAENLVSDVIAETSQSYDKPEKLREAANLMQAQQDLKLEQIEASKDNRTNIQKLAEYYQSEEGGGYSEEISIRMARNLPTKISEYFTASKAATDQGKTRDATRAATEDGLFGSGVAYKGKIDVAKHDSLSDFLASDDLKTRGDGVYNVKGEAVVIKGGKVVSRLVIQAQDDKKGWFTS